MTQFSPTPRKRLREPVISADKENPSVDEVNIAALRKLCATWGKDPEHFITIYLNLTTKSEFFRIHPHIAVMRLRDSYLCANPIDRGMQESAEVPEHQQVHDAPKDMDEVVAVISAALKKDRPARAPTRPHAKEITADEATPTTIVQCAPKKEAALAPCSVLELKAAFTAQREAQRVQVSDMAGLLNMSVSAIARAERIKANSYAAFFQSQAVIDAYAGYDEGVAKDLAQKVHATFYPQGITTLQELVRCIAYKHGDSITKMGEDLGIDTLAARIDPMRYEALNADNQQALRAHLASKIESLGHLGLTMALLDQYLPDPREKTSHTSDDAASNHAGRLKKRQQRASGQAANKLL